MVLVTMGSRKLQCNRIINAVINANIKDKIVIQAYCDTEYDVKGVEFLGFVGYEEMDKLIDKATVVIASGTGSIFRALLKGKKVIIFPRLGRFGEAIDDHGLDMKVLKERGYAEFVENAEDFKETYEKTLKKKFKKFVSNRDNFVSELETELEKL